MYKSVIYLDHNASSALDEEAARKMNDYSYMGNPSSNHQGGKISRKLINDFKKEILAISNLRNHGIILTSGGTESNALAIGNIVLKGQRDKHIPNIITSPIEHGSILAALEMYKELSLITVTYIPVNCYGVINIVDIVENLNINTKALIFMSGNNETGALNPIDKIAKIAMQHNLLFHCDCVQTFGKINNLCPGITSCSVSFHKLYGPKGIGCLIYDKSAPFYSLIPGSQNNGLRGGTENIPGIMGAKIALRNYMKNRAAKNKKMDNVGKFILQYLAERIPVVYYHEYLNSNTLTKYKKFIIVLTPKTLNTYNTLYFCCIDKINPKKCSLFYLESFEKNGIIISSGSACEAGNISHVPKVIIPDHANNVLRISWGDKITKDSAKKFCDVLIALILN